ncbi:hypothetical protein [Spirosoma panaciterrae]|uniref:hypothetical protein n=1 Tax=Spirosoma panaciterrae TaxID=496058 RepID=UPI0003760ACA|nr:hypothetical protein [Spirosoma panaciterrae]
MDEFKKIKNTLSKYSLSSLRGLVNKLHSERESVLHADNIKPLKHFVYNEIKTAIGNAKESYYNNVYYSILHDRYIKNNNKTQEEREKEEKEHILNIICYIYFKNSKLQFIDGKVYYKPKNDEKDHELIDLKNYKNITSNDTQKTALRYILYYWKESNDYLSSGTLGRYILEKNPKSSNVKLIRNKIELNGIIRETRSKDGIHISILFNEVDAKQTLSLLFYSRNTFGEEDAYWLAYSKERREGDISTGIGYLGRIEEDINSKLDSELTDKLFPKLRGKRLDISRSLDIIGNKRDDNLDRIKGIYKCHLFIPTTSGPRLSPVLVIIDNKARVIIYTYNQKKFPNEVYFGYYDLISINQESFLIINCDYNVIKSRVINYDVKMNFHFIFKTNEWNRNSNEWIGVRTIISHPKLRFPLASKVILKKLDLSTIEDLVGYKIFEKENISEEDLINKFFNLDAIYEKNEASKLLDDVANVLINSLWEVPIEEDNFRNVDLERYFEKNEEVKRFFLNGHSEILVDGGVSMLLKDMQNISPLHGDFICLNTTLFGDHQIYKYKSIHEVPIKKYPISIFPNGNARLKSKDAIYYGKVINYSKDILQLNFYRESNKLNIKERNIYMDITIDLNSYIDHNIPGSTIWSGIATRRIAKLKKLESRLCCVVRSIDSFELNQYESDIKIDSFQFYRLDRKYNGILTYLIGPINRMVRSGLDEYSLQYHANNNSYKRDFFYAACYLKSQGASNSIVKERLFQAYIHGFARMSYKGELVDENMKVNNKNKSQIKKNKKEIDNRPDVLKLNEKLFSQDSKPIEVFFEERKMLKAAIDNGLFSEFELVDYIKQHWFVNKKNNFAFKIFGENKIDVSIALPDYSNGHNQADLHTANIANDLLVYNAIKKATFLPPSEALSKAGKIICVGLFSNKLSMHCNNYDHKEVHGRYFKFIQGDNPKAHKIKCANFFNGSINLLEDNWIEFEIDENTMDYILISKVRLNKDAKQSADIFIVGGLNIEGTKLAGDFLASSWDTLYNLKDDDTNIKMKDSNFFTILYRVSINGFIEQVYFRASN